MSGIDQMVQVYQLRIWIREISSQVWRRLLVRGDSTIAQLHDTLQIAFGWSNEGVRQGLLPGAAILPHESKMLLKHSMNTDAR